MTAITVNAYAKINLSLDVLGKRSDGYHDVRMVMQMIDLYDSITISVKSAAETDEKAATIKLSSSLPELPLDDGNIAYRAAKLFLAEADVAASVCINIEKRIPVAAGLAGGSTDAAAVLLGLNNLLGQGFSIDKLMSMGKTLGADVPFCIMGNAAKQSQISGGSKSTEDYHQSGSTILSTCALAEGIGEVLTPIIATGSRILPFFKTVWIVLSKPPISVSTSVIYKKLKMESILIRPDTGELIKGLFENNTEKVSENMINVLENVTLREYPIVMYTKNTINQFHPLAALMSGSGPSVFGLFTDKSDAEAAFKEMKDVHSETYIVKTI